MARVPTISSFIIVAREFKRLFRTLVNFGTFLQTFALSAQFLQPFVYICRFFFSQSFVYFCRFFCNLSYTSAVFFATFRIHMQVFLQPFVYIYGFFATFRLHLQVFLQPFVYICRFFCNLSYTSERFFTTFRIHMHVFFNLSYTSASFLCADFRKFEHFFIFCKLLHAQHVLHTF